MLIKLHHVVQILESYSIYSKRLVKLEFGNVFCTELFSSPYMTF